LNFLSSKEGVCKSARLLEPQNRTSQVGFQLGFFIRGKITLKRALQVLFMGLFSKKHHKYSQKSAIKPF
jgi:hypothetical protein